MSALPTRTLLSLATIVVGFASAVHAQTETRPAAVEAAIAESRKACEPDKLELLPGFIKRQDVNGDGVPDYWLDYEEVRCGDAATFFCGTGGCVQQIIASMKDGTFKLVYDENAHRIRFAVRKGKPIMMLDLHGSACGKVGAAPCAKTRVWAGTTFK